MFESSQHNNQDISILRQHPPSAKVSFSSVLCGLAAAFCPAASCKSQTLRYTLSSSAKPVRHKQAEFIGVELGYNSVDGRHLARSDSEVLLSLLLLRVFEGTMDPTAPRETWSVSLCVIQHVITFSLSEGENTFSTMCLFSAACISFAIFIFFLVRVLGSTRRAGTSRSAGNLRNSGETQDIHV